MDDDLNAENPESPAAGEVPSSGREGGEEETGHGAREGGEEETGRGARDAGKETGRDARDADEEETGRGARAAGGLDEEETGHGDHDADGLDEDEDDTEDDDEREEGLETVTIEISGLSLYTHHGVSDAEREVGQRLMLDLRLEVGETDATVTDRVEDTVDYAEVCQLVALIAQQRSHRTLERLCSTIAERLLADYDLEGVWVKATKPEPPIALPVDEVSVEVWREAEE